MPYIKFDTPSVSNKLSPIGFITYMEKEDKEKGIDKEFWFNERENYIPGYRIFEDIEKQKGLGKDQFRYYTGSISFSEEELAFLNNNDQKLKEYGKAFINIYADNFNKNLSASDIRFYLKLESDRYYKGTEQEVKNGTVKSGTKKPGSRNTHFHFITGHKSADDSIKLSPNSNHTNTIKGAVHGGFSRDNLKAKAENLFDTMFQYNRPLEQTYQHFKDLKTNNELKTRMNAVDQSAKKSQSLLKYDYLSITEKHKKLSVLINYIQHGIDSKADTEYNIETKKVLQIAKERNYNGDIYKSLLNLNYRIKNNSQPESSNLTPYIIEYANFINAPYKQLPDSLKEDRFLRFARNINQKLPKDDNLNISELFDKEKQKTFDGSVYRGLVKLNNSLRNGQTISNSTNVVLKIAENNCTIKKEPINQFPLPKEQNNSSIISSLLKNLSFGNSSISSSSGDKEEEERKRESQYRSF